ncbi:MAG: transporter [Phycisphaerales bacterium]|nr:transporter [Phycisphaerales bacterium]
MTRLKGFIACTVFVAGISATAAQAQTNRNSQSAGGENSGGYVAQDNQYDFALAYQSGDEQVAEEEPSYAEEAADQHETLLWDGFLWGDRHFRKTPRPVGMPLYFEDPFINSDLRLIYVWHGIPNRSELRGGEIQVFAAQIRLALTERLQFIATKDGYSKVHTGITPDVDGWNDFAIGLKYALVVDHANDFILSTGFRWEWDNGTAFALQGNEHEISPFISFAKGWEKFNLIGAVSYRIPTNGNQGSQSIVWNLHLDYELFPDFYPLVEVHGIHWLTDGGRLPLSVEYLDVGNLGSSRVAGRDFFSAGIGFRWNLCDNAQLGMSWEFPLESSSENAQSSRANFNLVIGL